MREDFLAAKLRYRVFVYSREVPRLKACLGRTEIRKFGISYEYPLASILCVSV
jgi:hypothetical protein